MRPNPDKNRGRSPRVWGWLPASVILVAVLPGTAVSAPGTPDSPADPPVPVVKTVEPEPNPGLSAPVRATPPRVTPVLERRGKGPRTLDEITIEGEIAVPQVLFITARDRKRYRDLLHRRYLENSSEIGSELAFPVRLGSILGS